jgi:DNA polymerase V
MKRTTSKKTSLKFLNPLFDNPDFAPEIQGSVVAGFPSPAGDYLEKNLDFKELFVRNESATFFVQVVGDSMIDEGIHNGDILVVDKSLDPKDNSILVCFIDGEFTVKRVKKIKGELYLIAANPDFKPIKISESSDFRPWGVVTFTIHKFR